MAGAPLASMKAGAKTFIDIISQSTGGQPTEEIGAGSRIGIVSFADTAVQDTQMITSVDTLKDAVDGLTAGGSTNHADAFEQATALFEPSSGNAKVMVMFTDGNTTAGDPPAPVAAAARAQGIVIYCIGLVGSDGVDVSALNDWATDPDNTHVAVTPDAADLEALFAQLAANISRTGATNIEINEVVTSDFVITSILDPSAGSATMLTDRSLRWTIPALGVSASESAVLEFFIRHTGADSGTKLVNESITYTDTEGNVATFPEPTVTVECDTVVCAEKCPVPVELTVEGCTDFVVVDAGDVWPCVPGTYHPTECDHQECLPPQAGRSGRDPHGGGGERSGVPARHEDTDHSGPQFPGVPRRVGQVHQICGARGYGHVLPVGDVQRPQF